MSASTAKPDGRFSGNALGVDSGWRPKGRHPESE